MAEAPVVTLAACGLCRRFAAPLASGSARMALTDVSIKVRSGEILGLAGQSGAGKTTLARCLVGLERPDRGEVLLDGVPLAGVRGSAWRALRRRLQLVPQDAAMALNPRRTVAEAIGEPLRVHRLAAACGVEARVRALLDEVGLSPGCAARHPHELSGGERQRVAIARALGVEPFVLVADEPLASLDLLRQARLLDLFSSLRATRRLACVIITHDLGALATVADRVAVMQAGRIVEQGMTADLLARPLHPHTRALRDAVPRIASPSGSTF